MGRSPEEAVVVRQQQRWIRSGLAAALLLVAPQTSFAQTGACSLVQTDQPSGAQILRCGDDLTLRAAANTRYQLIDGTNLRLDSGALLIEFHPSQRRRNFQILTPQAIASVRGTTWAMELKPGRTATLVIDGSVTVKGDSDQGTVDLGPGQGVDVLLGTGPLQVKRWPEPRAAALLARFGR